jgi:hypothetical protein
MFSDFNVDRVRQDVYAPYTYNATNINNIIFIEMEEFEERQVLLSSDSAVLRLFGKGFSFILLLFYYLLLIN